MSLIVGRICIQVATDIQFKPDQPLPRGVNRTSVHLDDNGYYWWLYRYFEAANLPPRNGELIDLYGDSEISGYQLERLRRELSEARFDAAHRPEEWEVVIGWDGEQICAATESVSVVRRSEMLEIIDELLSLTTSALEHNLPVTCKGD